MGAVTDARKEAVDLIVSFLERDAYPPVNQFLEVFTEGTSFTPDEICYTSRKPAVSWVRHAAVYLLYTYYHLTLHHVGKRLGARDHSTISHSVSSMRAALVHDSSVDLTVYDSCSDPIPLRFRQSDDPFLNRTFATLEILLADDSFLLHDIQHRASFLRKLSRVSGVSSQLLCYKENGGPLLQHMRGAASYLLRRFRGVSYSDIGKWLCRDLSTVRDYHLSFQDLVQQYGIFPE